MEKISFSKGLTAKVAAHSSGVLAKKEQHLHSEAHQLADELSKKFAEPKRFGFYLRLATQYNHDFLRRIAGEVAESPAKNPGALFAFLVKKQKDQLRKDSNDSANH